MQKIVIMKFSKNLKNFVEKLQEEDNIYFKEKKINKLKKFKYNERAIDNRQRIKKGT